MAQPKNKHESRLQELLGAAKQMNIEVRTEKLFREVGYRVHSGCCRVKGQELIIIDRNARIDDQIDFLVELYGARQYVRIIVAESLDNALHLKTHFKLS